MHDKPIHDSHSRRKIAIIAALLKAVRVDDDLYFSGCSTEMNALLMSHDYHDLIQLFNRTFLSTYQTELVLGGDEPIYRPADAAHPYHRVIFARGYFASALHEIAHWCIAGAERRLLEDYGYWYLPDGRDEQQQAAFEQVEVKPQAVEWLLSASCGFRFQVSCDNLSGDHEPDRVGFTRKVRAQVLSYLNQGMPERAAMLSEALRAHYGVPALKSEHFAEPCLSL